MSEHLTKEQLEQYADRSLAPAELLDVDEHLSGCPDCREKAMGSTAASVAGIRLSLEPSADADRDHLDHEMMEGYVDGTLDDVDKEIVDGHLEFCRSCAEEVAELKSFRDMLASGPEKTYEPAAGAGMFQRMETQAVRRPVYRFAPAFAMAAAILIAAIVFLNHGNHNAPTPNVPQVAQSTPPANNQTASPFTPPAPAPPMPVPPAQNTVPSTSSKPTVEAPSTTSRTTVEHNQAPAEPPLSARTEPGAGHEKQGRSVPSKTAPSGAPAAGFELHPNDMMASSAPTPKPTAAMPVNGPTASTEVDGAKQMSPAAPPMAPSADEAVATTSTLPDSVKHVLSTGHLDLNTPEIRELTGAGAVEINGIGAAPAGFAVTSPVSTAVLTDRPSFSWEASKDASGYQVSVTDASGGDVEDSPVVSSTSWKAAKPLPRGELLKWQVKAMQNGAVVDTSPGGGARFRVVAADRAAQIEDAQKTFADQPTALGILYAQAGMLDDAERELAKASKADPGNEVVTKLLSDVRSVRQVP